MFKSIGVTGENIKIGLDSYVECTLPIFEGLKNSFPKAEIVKCNDIMVNLRKIKSTNELACIREGFRIIEFATDEVIKALRPGVTELEMVGVAQKVIYKNGAEYEGLGNINGAFLFIASVMPITAALNLASLMLIKDDGKKKEGASLDGVIKETLGNRKFRKLVVMTILWNCAQYFSIGFMGVFKTKDLLLSVFAVQIINISGQIARMFLSVPFGIYSDKKGYAKGFELAAFIAATGFLINIFITKNLWFLIILQTLCYNVSQAGTNQNSFNITYNYVNPKYISQAMAIKNSIGGICGFVSALVAGKIVSHIRAADNMLFGLNVLPQQVLSVISFVLAMAVVLYIKLEIEKEKIKLQ